MQFQYEGVTRQLSVIKHLVILALICLFLALLFGAFNLPNFKSILFYLPPTLTTMIGFVPVWLDFSFCLLLMFAALFNYGFHKDVSIPIFGSAFLFLGVVNIVQELTSAGVLDVNISQEHSVGFGWFENRLFFAISLCFAMILTKISEWFSQKAYAGFIIFSILFIGSLLGIMHQYLIHFRPLLTYLYSDGVIHRPLEMIPAIIFLFALLPSLIWNLKKRPSLFSYMLLLSLVPHLSSELYLLLDPRPQNFGTLILSQIFELIAVALPLIGIHFDNLFFYTLLDRSLKKSEELSKAKDRFISSLSSHLKTPLTNIMGFSSTLLEEYDGFLNERQSQSVRSIYDASCILDLRVNELIDISKIEEGRILYTPEKLYINSLLNEVFELVNNQHSNLNLELKLLEEDAEITSDKMRLKQVLFELMSNAIQFTKEGSVVLEAKRELNKLLLFVRDSGPGIPQEIKKSLSTSSFHASTKEGGLGLGLHICNKICDALESKLEIDVEKGTTITLSFNLAEKQTIQQLGTIYDT